MRKASNLTDDSGRGSQSDQLEAAPVPGAGAGSVAAAPGDLLPNMVSPSSLLQHLQQHQEHLHVPRPGSNISASGIDTHMRTGSSVSASRLFGQTFCFV